jgi:hypothetical protein
MARVIGIDPGLVHTGLVSLQFDTTARELVVWHHLVQGLDIPTIQGWVKAGWDVYVEQYRPRQRLGSDVRMVQAEQELRHAIPSAKFLTNMGIKRVVPQGLMELLEVWKFPTSSHHQDLRSAARIALLGMMKEERTNWVLAEMVRDHVDFQSWQVIHA